MNKFACSFFMSSSFKFQRDYIILPTGLVDLNIRRDTSFSFGIGYRRIAALLRGIVAGVVACIFVLEHVLCTQAPYNKKFGCPSLATWNAQNVGDVLYLKEISQDTEPAHVGKIFVPRRQSSCARVNQQVGPVAYHKLESLNQPSKRRCKLHRKQTRTATV